MFSKSLLNVNTETGGGRHLTNENEATQLASVIASHLADNNYTNESYVDTAVSNLIDGSSSALDTLNELATALGNDANYSTTIASALAQRLKLDGSNSAEMIEVERHGNDGTTIPYIKISNSDDILLPEESKVSEILFHQQDMSGAGPDGTGNTASICTKAVKLNHVGTFYGTASDLCFQVSTGKASLGATREAMRIEHGSGGLIRMKQPIDMTNQLISSVLDPISSQDAVTKKYTDDMLDLKLNLSGGVIQGELNLNGDNKIVGVADPTDAQNATNKQYVDTADALLLPLTGGTISGSLTVGGGITLTGGNVDCGGALVQNMSAPLISTDACRKQYVDDADALHLPLTGGAMTGELVVSAISGWQRNGVNQLVNIVDVDVSLTDGKAMGSILLMGSALTANRTLTFPGASALIGSTGFNSATVQGYSYGDFSVINRDGTYKWNIVPDATDGSSEGNMSVNTLTSGSFRLQFNSDTTSDTIFRLS